MPQGGARTPTEKVDFKRMLQNINILYLGCSVLILQELSYLSRFWRVPRCIRDTQAMHPPIHNLTVRPLCGRL